MSKKNYNRMYNNNEVNKPENAAHNAMSRRSFDLTEVSDNEPTVTTTKTEPETIVAPSIDPEVTETPKLAFVAGVSTEAEPEVKPNTSENPKTAFVIGCARLNVREEPRPDAKVIYVLDSNCEVIIEEDLINSKYYKICTVFGIEGYCVKDYLKMK